MSRGLRQDLHTLAGAYALNALPAEDLRRFEEHMVHCEACVQEVRGLAETTALLGSAAAEAPPEGMRRRVLAEVAHTRQLAPAPVEIAVRRSGWRDRAMLLGLAASLLIALVLGGVAVNLDRQVDELRRNEQAVAEILAAPDATYVSGSPEEGVSATVVAAESVGGLVFTADGLRPLEDRDYQLWLADADGSVRSGGLVRLDSDGSTVPLLASGLDGAEGVAVTIEPAGGSPQPTSDPIMQMELEG
ncbi:anti-sigma-K factor RskA [Spinactinospora alkalitolerans]|uniref:Regulator of SigK n=1 Tax=Spinactinospora alkalitolerans TaxID=687207 RepID=A0A852TTS0_9ACTN|nr:anti-sigma factor [Spinactinospora alkalitolerans]NYE47328.1 anti-sigma-K factor RskA [Spinactinospora alkalitolerans]